MEEMKKLIFVIFLFLVGCESQLTTLDSNNQCLTLCWMGINPGITTFDEAKTILTASDQIDQKWLNVTNSKIYAAVWYTKPTHEITGKVGLTFENGVVKTISLTNPPFTMKNIIDLIGEPDKISYFVLDTPDGPGKMLYYAVYFTPRKIMIFSGGGWNGPQPDDSMKWLRINTEFDSAFHQEIGVIQPWRGYGHIKDYLPDVEIPPTYRTEQP